jgi:hypothetical protein
VDCYLQAVPHLYTMCRHVKSIEIIEFGYEKSTEGTNGAKSEYCVDKQKLSMARPYQAALKEATPNAERVDKLRELQDMWAKSMVELKWKPGRPTSSTRREWRKPYEIFKERADAVRVAIAAHKDKAAPSDRRQGQEGQARNATAQEEERKLSHAALSAERNPGVSDPALSNPTRPFTTGHGEPSTCDRELSAILGEGGCWRPRCPGFAFARSSSRWRCRREGHRAPRRADRGGWHGTGKTFAYLVPALLYGGKVIVSTGTKTLQDQLFQRDLPPFGTRSRSRSRSPSSRDARTTCATIISSGRPPTAGFRRATTLGTCRKSSRSHGTSDTGDRGQLADVPENASIWPS